MSQTYPKFENTTFPDEVDNFTLMSDVSLELLPLVKRYNEHISHDDIEEAKLLLQMNPELDACLFNAFKYNQLIDAGRAVELYVKNMDGKLDEQIVECNKELDKIVVAENSRVDAEKSRVKGENDRIDAESKRESRLSNLESITTYKPWKLITDQVLTSAVSSINISKDTNANSLESKELKIYIKTKNSSSQVNGTLNISINNQLLKRIEDAILTSDSNVPISIIDMDIVLSQSFYELMYTKFHTSGFINSDANVISSVGRNSGTEETIINSIDFTCSSSVNMARFDVGTIIKVWGR